MDDTRLLRSNNYLYSIKYAKLVVGGPYHLLRDTVVSTHTLGHPTAIALLPEAARKVYNSTGLNYLRAHSYSLNTL